MSDENIRKEFVKNLYKMKIGEMIEFGGDYWRRVPGGWVMSQVSDEAYISYRPVFIPFDNEGYEK